MSTLEIKDLHVSVETKEGRKQILKGATLTVHSGETHAIMGPNGSGKSTLAYTLAGHPKYEVDSGQALLDGQDLLKMTPDERAKAGLFLAMQYPVEVPGVSMTNFLRTAKTEVDGKAPAIRQWTKDLNEAMKRLRMDPSSPGARSTRASRVARRSGPRFCSWSCSSPSSPSWTKLTPVWTWTPCGSFPKESTGPRRTPAWACSWSPTTLGSSSTSSPPSSMSSPTAAL